MADRARTPIWQLSAAGRAMTWRAWRRAGGNGLPNSTQAYRVLGVESAWPATLTLGEIEDACPMSGRGLARFARDSLNRPDMAVPYRRPDGHD